MSSASHRATPESLVVTVTEVAALLRVSRATAYRIARQLGRRTGRRLLLSRAVLLEWLEGEPQGKSAPRSTKPRGGR